MKYLAWQSKEDVAYEIGNGLEGLGFEYAENGSAVGFSREDRLANGTSSSPGDNKLLWSNFERDEKFLLDNYKASNPEVPEDVAEAKIYHQYNEFYHRVGLSDPIEADQFAPILNELIVEFVFKCIVAEEGQFEQVYADGYQKLIDNGLQDLLDQRGEWYDANVAK